MVANTHDNYNNGNNNDDNNNTKNKRKYSLECYRLDRLDLS